MILGKKPKISNSSFGKHKDLKVALVTDTEESKKGSTRTGLPGPLMLGAVALRTQAEALRGPHQAGFSFRAKSTDPLHPKAHSVVCPQTYRLQQADLKAL